MDWDSLWVETGETEPFLTFDFSCIGGRSPSTSPMAWTPRNAFVLSVIRRRRELDGEEEEEEDPLQAPSSSTP